MAGVVQAEGGYTWGALVGRFGASLGDDVLLSAPVTGMALGVFRWEC
jgi:hypothetical protein